MQEQKLEIVEKGQYKNLELKTKYARNGRKFVLDENGNKKVVTQGLQHDHYVDVVKKYVEGREVVSKFPNAQNNYSVTVTYAGEVVSFFLNFQEHEMYKNCGGEGDTVRILLKVEEKVDANTGGKVEYQNLYFSKVESPQVI